eukprot:scaffold2797_cov112-Isochrysis_galbana.AAC.2
MEAVESYMLSEARISPLHPGLGEEPGDIERGGGEREMMTMTAHPGRTACLPGSAARYHAIFLRL